MARIVISFKEKSEEEMKLHDEILKRACGDTSAYVKRVFREMFELDDYTYRIQRSKSNEDNEQDNEEQEEAVEVEFIEVVEEEKVPEKPKVRKVKKVRRVKKEDIQAKVKNEEIQKDDDLDDDLEISDEEFASIFKKEGETVKEEMQKQASEEESKTKSKHKSDNIDIINCMKAFEGIK